VGDQYGWEIGNRVWRAMSPPIGVVAPGAFDQPSVVSRVFRGGYYIVNGDGPVSTGHLQVQRNRDGAGWEDWPGQYGKDVEPGWFGGGQVHVPQWVDFSLDFPQVGEVWGTRLKVTACGDVMYSSVLTVTSVGVQEGDAAIFLKDHGEVVTFNGELSLWGIFRDPSRPALGMAGTQPTVTVEAALATGVEHGHSAVFAERDDSWTVCGRRPDGTGLLDLRLQEAA